MVAIPGGCSLNSPNCRTPVPWLLEIVHIVAGHCTSTAGLARLPIGPPEANVPALRSTDRRTVRRRTGAMKFLEKFVGTRRHYRRAEGADRYHAAALVGGLPC